MIETVLQIFVVLVLVVIIILVAFKVRKERTVVVLPDNYRELLYDYVQFYRQLDEEGKEKFEKRTEQFLSSVQITGINAIVEDIDRLLIGAGAIIPVFAIPDWQYVNLKEVLLYPGTFNTDFDQSGPDRPVSGMVGTGPMQHVMVLAKWELRQGFINSAGTRNTAIHEFVHLVDKMDGTVDGVPEIILERKYTGQWRQMMETTIQRMRTYGSDIDMYGATNTAEFFAVVSEYFFERPDLLQVNHPDLYAMLVRIYRTGK